jgi:2-polyprenyl-6-methoxyphenol hydroxylase-like FAD-dependent oxidoreductase
VSSQLQKNHAIVIGGSIAGLVTARVLLKHFEHVTVIERDHYPQELVSRPGIPQGRQIHTTLLRGQHALESLFPGLTAKLLAHGAIERDYGNESYYFYGGRCPRIPPVLHGWNCSRHLLEWQLRQELNAYPQLTIIEGHEVCHLLFEESSDSVIGVQFRDRTHTSLGSNIQDLQANLVVDASGSGSSAPRWLEELGYNAPPEETVTVNLGYATRFYEPHADFKAPWKGIAIQATEQPPRGGVLMEIEGRRWMVVLSGTNGDYPPTEDQAFLEFAKTLPNLALYEAMKCATPRSKIYGYRYAENCLRHFEQLERQPEGFIIVGDAVCNFNPIYGQGMTVAALEALALDLLLQKGGMQKGFAHAFQKKVFRLLVAPWMLATGADRRDSHAKTRGFISNLARRYVDRLIALLPKDQALFLTFLEVVHMLRHPVVFFSPRVVLRVLAKKH